MNLNFPGEEKRLRRPVEMHQARFRVWVGGDGGGGGRGYLDVVLSAYKRHRDPKREGEGGSESLAGKYLTSRLQVWSSLQFGLAGGCF